jgi:hypothetical protein
MHREYPKLLGLHFGLVTTDQYETHEFHRFFAIGINYERSIVPELLEAELSVPVAVSPQDGGRVALPVDLHFKIPFHPSQRLSPYLAAGPAFDFDLAPETGVLWGGSLAGGTYLWLEERAGLDIEADANLVFEGKERVFEVLLAVGPAVRF